VFFGEGQMKKIIVTGIGGPAGRNVSNLLFARGYDLVGTDMKPQDEKRFPFFQVPAADHPAFLKTLRKIASGEKVDWIIPTVSEELPVLGLGWNWNDEFPLLLSSGDGVVTANDKYLTSQKLSSKGVAIPRFVLPSQVHSPEELAEKIGWPCISKPRVGRGGREVTWHPQEDWPVVSSLSDHYILQEFASGTDFAPNVFANPGKNSTVVVLEKTELKEGIVGNAKSVKRVDAADVASLAAAAANALNLRGPLDIDIRRRLDGLPVVLEINARFGANIAYAGEVMDAALNYIEASL
jgi:carbamoylphosphate synthase large subunit